jgi:hypothetical protein
MSGPLSPISTQEIFPRTENLPKILLLKVENFQLENVFPTENLCRPITFYKIFSLRKICLSGNGPLRPIPTKEKFPRTENFPKISLLKVEHFQLQIFFPTENLCRPITFYKIFFLRKIFLGLGAPIWHKIFLGFHSLGCWKDTWIRAIQPLEKRHNLLMNGNYKLREDPLRKCAIAALDNKMKLFAIENGGQCLGETTITSSYKIYGAADHCKGRTLWIAFNLILIYALPHSRLIKCACLTKLTPVF